MENPGLSSSAENTSQKLFIRTDKVSEILNDSDSDGGSFSELSDSHTCKVNSPISSSSNNISSEEKEAVQPNMAEAGREHTGPHLNAQIQIFS